MQLPRTISWLISWNQCTFTLIKNFGVPRNQLVQSAEEAGSKMERGHLTKGGPRIHHLRRVYAGRGTAQMTQDLFFLSAENKSGLLVV